MNAKSIKKRITATIAASERRIAEAMENKNKAEKNVPYMQAALALVPKDVRYVSCYPSSIIYTVQVRGFNSASTKRLLEKHIELEPVYGMRLELSSTDSPEYNQRTYKFQFFMEGNTSTWSADFCISICCELLEGGTACRRVQVGEKVEVIKTPEYKFVCK